MRNGSQSRSIPARLTLPIERARPQARCTGLGKNEIHAAGVTKSPIVAGGSATACPPWYDASHGAPGAHRHARSRSLTPRRRTKIRELMAEDADVSVLRVAVEGGGCSGFQYGLGFDRGAQEGDHEFECEGVKVVVDPFSAPHLRGCSVDYLETIQESGFKIDNPNAVASCGCGPSFQVRRTRPADAASRRRLRLGLQRTNRLARPSAQELRGAERVPVAQAGDLTVA